MEAKLVSVARCPGRAVNQSGKSTHFTLYIIVHELNDCAINVLLPLSLSTIVEESASMMYSPNQEKVRIAAAKSQSTAEQYLAKPSDRAARINALRDAKSLVTELQDGDDAYSDKFAQVFPLQYFRSTLRAGKMKY